MKYLPTLSLLLFSTLTFATPISLGTYEKGNQRAVLTQWEQHGGEYRLQLTDSLGRSTETYSAASPENLPVGISQILFSPFFNEYDEEPNQNPCRLYVDFPTADTLKITPDNRCSVSQRQSYTGTFKTPAPEGLVPPQFHGYWGKTSRCQETYEDVYAAIDANGFTHDADYGMAVVTRSQSLPDGTFLAWGVETYEGIATPSFMQMRLLPNGRLQIFGNHHAAGFDAELVRCELPEPGEDIPGPVSTPSITSTPAATQPLYRPQYRVPVYTSPSSSNTQWGYVRGYYRRDGTYVSPHRRRTR